MFKDKDKMMSGTEKGLKNKDPIQVQEYFFSGGLEYLPKNISAKSLEEATEIWEKSRVKVNQN
jgi:hypothetical protein